MKKRLMPVLIVLMVLSACNSQSTPSSPSITDAVARVSPAVVRVVGEEREGSGMIIDKAGYVLTSNHVVEGTNSATVTFPDGHQVQGAVPGRDRISDLAIIKFKGNDLPVVTLGSSSKLKTGEDVIAVGFPLALGGSATTTRGIFSAFRTFDDKSDITYIQTDTAINPGSSGGPLINIKGEVIGINAWKYVGEATEGMNFAIAIDSAKPIIQKLISGELLSTPTPEPWKTFTNDAYGYSIAYPSFWKIQTLDRGGCNIFTSKARIDVSIPVGALNPDVGKYTLDEWVNLSIKQYKEVGTCLEVILDKKIIHRGLEAREVNWLSQYTSNLSEWRVRNFWVIAKSGWIYQIQCWAEESEYDLYQPIFDESIASLRLSAVP